MARSISDEELQLKKRARRRLIGAIVLAAVAAVVLPMVLDSEPRQVSQEVSIKIPSPDSAPAFTSKVVPLAPGTETKPAAETAAPAKPQPAEQPAAPAKEAAKEAVKEAPKAEKAEAPKPPAKAAANGKTAEAGKGQFVVQVVALSDAAKAQQIRQQIAAAGIKSYTEIVKTAKGDVTRVRAGPFATRAAAEKARDQLKAMGLNGNVAAK